MFTPSARRQLLRILPFGLFWLISSVMYTLIEKGLMADLDAYPATGNPYDFGGNMVINSIMATLVGLAIGAIEVLYLNQRFLRGSFRRKIVLKTFFYLLAVTAFLLVNSAVNNAKELGLSAVDPDVWENVWTFASTWAFWSIEIYISLLIVLSLFFLEVVDNLGHGVLNNFFIGKYRRPIEEVRIFLFLDMKSSTTIAEKLGNAKYFELLQAYFEDLSDSILQYRGEVYQYVGDEVIITWRLRAGLRDLNCLRCFFAMRKALNENAEFYQARFGIVPTFKGGMHVGPVTAGAIGVLKKEIIFTGDVLNTTARIQGLCNSKQVDLLISKELLNRMELDTRFTVRALGTVTLRGRDERVALYTVALTEDALNSDNQPTGKSMLA